MATAVACCVYVMNMTAVANPGGGEGPGNGQRPCSPNGTSCTKTCEQSSDGNITSGGKQASGVRAAKCYTYCSSEGANWVRTDCKNSPGDGWVKIGTNSDGSCCWISPALALYPTQIEDHPDGFYVVACDGAACPE